MTSMSECPKLDPAPTRKLTSREISKVIGSALGGLVASQHNVLREGPVTASQIRSLLEACLIVLDVFVGGSEQSSDQGERFVSELMKSGCAEWATMLSALLVGFIDWCELQDVRTAIRWWLEKDQAIERLIVDVTGAAMLHGSALLSHRA